MISSEALNSTFYGKNVLITGHTGFKGSWLVAWLKSVGANIIGLALNPSTNPNHFEAASLSKGILDLRIDIRDKSVIKEAILSSQPDYIFHLAAQSLVRASYEDPLTTWETNVLGTLNVLEALRNLSKSCVAVIITSDKCYDNFEWVWGYRETDPMGGPDPYSASKGAAELAIRSHIKSFFPKETTRVRIASARAGNVIGGGDWAKDRIISDCVRAWSSNSSVELRNPFSTRPWQHVLEPLSGYIRLAMSLSTKIELHGESFNFGPRSLQNHSVIDLVKEMSLHWKKVRWNDISKTTKGPYESNLLKLNCDKALHYLNWYSVMGFEDTVRMTADWYKQFYESPNTIREVTINQILNYTAQANRLGLDWAK